MSTDNNNNNNSNYEVIQQKTRCGWCRNPMVMSEPLTDSNFIQTQYTWHDRPLYALYCSSCLANEIRVKDPKVGIDKQTLEEIEVHLIAEAQENAAKSAPPATEAEVAAQPEK